MSGSALTYEQLTGRLFLGNDLALIAEIVGSNSTAALTFDDSRRAVELLAGPESHQSIVAAYSFDSRSKLFASYPREDLAADLITGFGCDVFAAGPG